WAEGRARVPGDAHDKNREPSPGRPAVRHARAHEGGHAVEREQDREEISGVAEAVERAPAEPRPDRPDRARLVQRVQGRVVIVERHEAEAGQSQSEDALGLAHPAAGLALGLARETPLRRLARGVADLARPVPVLAGLLGQDLLDRHLLGHHTSRITGSTTGLRWNRWLTKRRTAPRTTAPTSSRSNASGSCREASASRTAVFTSSISASASFM